MFKALVWVVILGALAGGSWWMMNEMNRDTGYLVGYAILTPDDQGMLRFEVLTPLSMVQFDQPESDGSGTGVDWAGWMRDHYTLKDSAGNAVTLDRLGRNTPSIGQAVAEKANAEFIAGAKIKAGEKYSLEVVPTVTEGKSYKHEFTAAPKAYEKVNFLPNG